MTDKLNFFEYCAEQEAEAGENVQDWVEHFKKYYTKGVWESYRTGEPRHDGDCVNRPYTCDLCVWKTC